MMSKTMDAIVGTAFIIGGFAGTFLFVYFMSMGLAILKIPLMIFGLLALILWGIYPKAVKILGMTGFIIGLIRSFF